VGDEYRQYLEDESITRKMNANTWNINDNTWKMNPLYQESIPTPGR